MTQSQGRGPQGSGSRRTEPHGPNAALLIDFDNVTMGMHSDLSKELKALLESDIIRGKVAVQRAYADWRRYPQYVVPLAEASIDLIFAPAYGSSKKNATDIRLAIDALELVFTRPEIGTFILLTGDSDFSSLVIKLKEYGKYVIGVGIEESSSDLLVQNCDEYYSYSALTGLSRASDEERVRMDPWELVEKALARMVERGDVLRSDRLKQVMVELDPGFDEKEYGFQKFSKFLVEAAGRGLVELKKLGNGQYEIRPPSGARAAPPREERRGREERRPRREEPRRQEGRREEARRAPVAEEEGDPLRRAYELLTEAVRLLSGGGERPVRDSDVKRKMLELRPEFDEGELGFGKFSRFLRQAHDGEVIDLEKTDQGTYLVFLPGRRRAPAEAAAAPPAPRPEAPLPEPPAPEVGAPVPEAPEAGVGTGRVLPTRESLAAKMAALGLDRLGLRLRRGVRSRERVVEAPPPILEGQAIVEEEPDSGRRRRGARRRGAPLPEPEGGGAAPAPEPAAPSERPEDPVPADVDLGAIGLPEEEDAILQYLVERYKGVGRKTAERLVEEFGGDLFRVLHEEPDRIRALVPGRRGDQLLEAWRADLRRRAAAWAIAARAEAKEAGSRTRRPLRTRRAGAGSTADA